MTVETLKPYTVKDTLFVRGRLCSVLRDTSENFSFAGSDDRLSGTLVLNLL